jgi:hypothetical protein
MIQLIPTLDSQPVDILSATSTLLSLARTKGEVPHHINTSRIMEHLGRKIDSTLGRLRGSFHKEHARQIGYSSGGKSSGHRRKVGREGRRCRGNNGRFARLVEQASCPISLPTFLRWPDDFPPDEYPTSQYQGVHRCFPLNPSCHGGSYRQSHSPPRTGLTRLPTGEFSEQSSQFRNIGSTGLERMNVAVLRSWGTFILSRPVDPMFLN